MMRIGYGEDIHSLVPGEGLKVLGVSIPYPMRPLAHSDGDFALHAVADAILGALALGDIGQLFPDNDPKTEGLDSAIILEAVVRRMEDKGFHVGNIDVLLVAEKPKFSTYIWEMRSNLAGLLHLDIDRVSVKAMTEEGLGPVGEGKAMRASCVVLLEE